MKLINFFIFFAVVGSEDFFNDVDLCISLIQNNVKGKTTTKSLSGIVGIGWDDLTNSPTLPILATEFKKCLTDNSNSYLLPDNVFAVPIENAKVEKTSTQIDSFKSMMESHSNKIGVSASATVKGVQVGGSFSSENSQSKKSFEKESSIMLLNKIQYSAFELFADENKGFDQYFIERIEEIAETVKEGKMLWGKFLAEVFISDFGTHMINKATAGAEIEQQTYISKSETYKGEETMDAYKAEVSIGFKAIAKVTIGYESEKKTSETHTTSSVTTNSILRTRGGPDISRISGQKKNESMLYVENLVGLKQSGKYIFELIPAMKLANYSDQVKYTVQKLIQNATEDYYSFNYRPGCMDIESENFNKIANVDDGSCISPKVLFAFSGVFQTCDSISSKTETGENYYSSDRCEDFEKPNPMTSNFSCANGIKPEKIYSLTKFYNDRKAKIQKEKCGFFSFAFGCKNETVEMSVIDEIRLDAFWCPLNKTMKEENETKGGPNRLDKICRHKTLSKLNTDPDMLKLYFNVFKDPMEEIVKNVCSLDPSKIFEDSHVKEEVGKVGIYYDSMARAFSSADEESLVSPRTYSFSNTTTYKKFFWWQKSEDSQVITYDINSSSRKLLQMRRDQFNIIKYYPNVLKKILPIVEIPAHLHFMRNLSDALVNSPKLLEQLIYNDTDPIYKAEPPQITYFGGAFKSGTLNPFTGTYDCPPYFKPITILTDFNLCLSTDISTKYPLRLGGFYNCDSDLKLCPLGYSTYLGTILNGCEHYYCIRFHSRDDFSPPIINRPPYTDYKMANAETIPTD